MWFVKTTQLDSTAQKVVFHEHGAPVSMRQTYELFLSNASFRETFIEQLSAVPFSAYFWETPPITTDTLDRPFEYVITNAPRLASVLPDVQAFDEHFRKDTSRAGIVTFENLGRDAILVVPRPLEKLAAYTHWAAFLRGAPRAQVHALLEAVARAVLAKASHRPLWVSTAGMGVSWLHVRLDSQPKYYRHIPYTSFT